jgi:GT2 family glycosyltransferase
MISVVTLAGGRPDHLRNVVTGLARQTMQPTGLIVAVIQDTPYDLPEAPFPIRQMMVSGPHLPLAAARNAAAKAAVGDKLVFLDMDCIPTPDLVADYDRFLTEEDGLLMGEVMYLPGGATQ